MASPLCCSNPPTLTPTCGRGSVVDDFGGIKSYIAAASNPDSKRAVILISDVFGFEAPILRTIADTVAASGFFVVVPDFHHGDPLNLNDSARPFPVWIQSHSTDKGFQEAQPVIAALKHKGLSSVGAAGYCWGAKVVTELAKAGEIQAAVLLHPHMVTVDDMKEVKCPMAVLGAETDHLSPPELVKQYEAALAEKSEVDYFVKIFPGVAHGWACRYKADDEPAVRSAEEARTDMIGWFNKHLN